jgi:hypothetical protein
MKRSTLRALTTALAALAVAAHAAAQQPAENRLDLLPRVASSSPVVMPVFSQLLLFAMPKNFKPASDSVKFGKFIQQSVPIGQDLNRWTEMITVTGEQNAAGRPGITPRKLAEGIAGFFKKTCPDSFAVASFGPLKVERYDGFATVISCGTADEVVPQSETLLLVTIKGDKDLYTLQWAELGPASKTALPIDAARWQDRLARIAPVLLCDIVPGEAPPYPSCTRRF